jgi:hypothetical protein
MITYTNRLRIRGEGGHAWTRDKCRFCGIARVDFKLVNRPECQWHATKNPKPALPGEPSGEPQK